MKKSSNITDISGGFKGEPKTVEEWMKRELADPKTRTAIDKQLKKMRAEQDSPFTKRRKKCRTW